MFWNQWPSTYTGSPLSSCAKKTAASKSLALCRQLPDSFLELLLLLLLGAEILRQEGKAEGLVLSSDEGGVELVRAGLLLVGEMQEMGDSVAVVHGFVAGEAAVLASCPGDDGVFIISPSS